MHTDVWRSRRHYSFSPFCSFLLSQCVRLFVRSFERSIVRFCRLLFLLHVYQTIFSIHVQCITWWSLFYTQTHARRTHTCTDNHSFRFSSFLSHFLLTLAFSISFSSVFSSFFHYLIFLSIFFRYPLNDPFLRPLCMCSFFHMDLSPSLSLSMWINKNFVLISSWLEPKIVANWISSSAYEFWSYVPKIYGYRLSCSARLAFFIIQNFLHIGFSWFQTILSLIFLQLNGPFGMESQSLGNHFQTL